MTTAEPRDSAVPTIGSSTQAPPSSSSSPCLASELGRVSQTVRNLGKGTDGEFHFADDFRLFNVSKEACSLSGWVYLGMFGDDSAVLCPRVDGSDPCHGRPKSKDDPVNQRVTDTGSDGEVILQPGHAATFAVGYEGVICLHHPYRLELRLPQDVTHPMQVVGTPICVQNPVTVSPFAGPS